LEEIKELNKEIPELKTNIAKLDKQLTDISTEHAIRTEGLGIIVERKKIDADITNIQTVDIPALETKLEQSEKDIKTYQENVEQNEIIENETTKEKKGNIKN
jgi:chromosome segregation ATPase